MLRTIWKVGTPGTVFRAFPLTESLSSWSAKAVAFVEAGPPSAGKFAAIVDDEQVWAIFKGAIQPAHFGLAVDVVQFSPKLTVTIG